MPILRLHAISISQGKYGDPQRFGLTPVKRWEDANSNMEHHTPFLEQFETEVDTISCICEASSVVDRLLYP
jgi:hypothetical protein